MMNRLGLVYLGMVVSCHEDTVLEQIHADECMLRVCRPGGAEEDHFESEIE